MGSSSNARQRLVCVPSVPLAAVYAAPAWPLVALCTLLALDSILLALDGTLHPVADVHLLALSPADDLRPGVEQAVLFRQSPQPGVEGAL